VTLAAVTFDYWNTLVHEEPGHLRGRRIAAWLGLLEEAGVPVTEDALGALFDRSWVEFSEAWKQNRQLLAPQAAEMMIAELGHDLAPPVRDMLVEAFVMVALDAELHLTPGVADVLAALDERGLRLGIICDVGMTPSTLLRAHLEQHGVLHHFDHWSFSDDVGLYKPDPRIFEHALAGLGSPPHDSVAHVGDLRRTDVAGARAMGMIAVRYAGILDDTSDEDPALPEADHVVRHHDELLAALGFA
jgi:HAD superfamily hydrolase (TIGR01549 family)